MSANKLTVDCAPIRRSPAYGELQTHCLATM